MTPDPTGRALVRLCRQRCAAADRMRAPGAVARPAEVQAARALEALIDLTWAALVSPARPQGDTHRGTRHS